jgi:hypothetical protein
MLAFPCLKVVDIDDASLLDATYSLMPKLPSMSLG